MTSLLNSVSQKTTFSSTFSLIVVVVVCIVRISLVEPNKYIYTSCDWITCSRFICVTNCEWRTEVLYKKRLLFGV